VPSTRRPAKSVGEYDVFVCCPDPARHEPCGTLAAYLTRAGFRVFFEADGGGKSPVERLALVQTASDFILFLPPPDADAPQGSHSQWHAEVSAALATGRNIIRLTLPGEPAQAAAGLSPELGGLGAQQAATYDPDRLAESLSVIQHCLSTDSIVNDRHMMRRTRRWFLFAGLLLLAGFSAQTVPILIREWKRPKPLPPVAPFVLYWSAFAEREAGGIAEEFPLAAGTAVKGGDRVRIAFGTSADGFAYVVGKDTRGRVWVLFPTERLKGASRVRAGRTYSAPADAGWLTIDPQAGLDTLYVFAGHDPLQNLEELVEEPETGNDVGARRSLVDQTVNGLLDGRHYPAGQRVWIRSTALIDQSLKPAPGPDSFSAILGRGEAVTHPAATQPGLVHALAEIKVSFVRQ
jgi:hypothetical protein